MDGMQICTIRDLMQKSGCQMLKEFEEYLALSQSMDEMEKAENEYKAALASDDPSAIVTDTISILTDMVDAVCGLHSLREWLADDAPEDPVQEQHIRDITADIREMLTQLTDDAELRACIGADTADAGARELREALEKLNMYTDPENNKSGMI